MAHGCLFAPEHRVLRQEGNDGVRDATARWRSEDQARDAEVVLGGGAAFRFGGGGISASAFFFFFFFCLRSQVQKLLVAVVEHGGRGQGSILREKDVEETRL